MTDNHYKSIRLVPQCHLIIWRCWTSAPTFLEGSSVHFPACRRSRHKGGLPCWSPRSRPAETLRISQTQEPSGQQC